MKKLNLFAVACMVAAFSFAQNAGQFSFGAGGNFVAPGAGDKDFNANIGYFAMDGLMISFDFGMGMEYNEVTYHEVGVFEEDGVTPVLDDDGEQMMEKTDEIAEKNKVEGDFDWGLALRYYPKDNLFVEGTLATGQGDDPDVSMGAGVSLELAFDGKLWFEPMIKFNMPGETYGKESQRTLGLTWQFRYTF